MTIAHWRCTGVEGDKDALPLLLLLPYATTVSASSYGTAGFTPDASADGFVAYDNLTEANVLAWVWGQSETWKADVEESIATKINAIANPTTGAGVPW